MHLSLIGTGLMGQALGERLLAEHQPLTVYNRDHSKTSGLAALGAKLATTPGKAVQQAEIVLLMLSDAAAIHAVLQTLTKADIADRLWLQLATIAPSESIEIGKQIKKLGGRYLECPVLGSLPEARSGRLILMPAGNQSDFESALPLLSMIGRDPQFIGETGQGAAMKLAMNQLIAGLTASFSLSLGLVEKQGIQVEQFMSLLRESALYAPTFDKKLSRMLDRHFDGPNFPTKHLAKDTRLFLSVAQSMGLNTQGLEGIAGILDKTLEMGLADTDYSAIYAAVNPASD
ncbi:NAD(P)-dependent oxidoreductase [Methylophaga lonarensis]|uniref:NAD(P)-dependent oxidoreductase n=1 Tax=Methylophaga lonarensis TaxID=999151 RepID=UPI003D2B5599